METRFIQVGGLAFIEGVNVNFPEYSLAAGEYVIVAQPAYFSK